MFHLACACESMLPVAGLNLQLGGHRSEAPGLNLKVFIGTMNPHLTLT
jgi:hypothetical protein